MTLALACGASGNESTSPTPSSDAIAVSTDIVSVTPTASELPQGWWNPIDDKSRRQIEYSLMGIKMWGNCHWYRDDPTPKTESAVRLALSDVIGSPLANEIGVIQGADLDAVCEGSASVADIEVEVQDGRQAAMASVLMTDLLDSCVAFYASPDAPTAYRIAITYIDMLWMLDLDAPRWPRRDFWGVRQWCDQIVEGAVAS